MGTSFEEINDVEFSTSQGWLLMQTIDCSGCYDQSYDYSTSLAYAETTTDLSVFNPDGSYYLGIKAYDNVCLGTSNAYCAKSFPFFNVYSTGLNTEEGTAATTGSKSAILGLTANPAAKDDG